MKPIQTPEIPETEGIKYAGSKLKLIPHILRLAASTKSKTVFDGFSGTTRVSQALAQTGYRVIASDVSVWSKTFAQCYLKNTRKEEFFSEIVDHLNQLKPKDGWFTRNYGGSPNGATSAGKDGLKKPFQLHNTRKVDAIREEIDGLGLTEIEKSVILTSLILAMDKVDSTLGHHASYLNRWSPRSYNKLQMRVPRLFPTRDDHEVHQADILEILDDIEVDLAYLDPPYGSNNEKMPPSRVRYASYYHLWTSVILDDKPDTFGKSKRRNDTSDREACSVFEEFRTDAKGNFVAVSALAELLNRLKARYIILSYSSGGRATAENLFEILEQAGKIREFLSVDYRRNVMASMRWTNEWVKAAEAPNKEFLFLIEKV